MSAALRAMLAGVFDYAGLFPPASLPLDEVVDNYAQYRKSADTWMLRSMVVPVGLLSELMQLQQGIGRLDGPLSVLGTRVVDDWQSVLQKDLSQISDFLTTQSESRELSALELALPPDVLPLRACRVVSRFHLPIRHLYFEMPVGVADERFFAQIADAGQQSFVDRLRVGIKLRTGGLEKTAFPTSEQLAEVIDLCRRHQLSWKATAGLHHALPYHAAKIGATMHGFLNLLSAVTMTSIHDLDLTTIQEILNDGDSNNFSFDEERLQWRDLRADLVMIRVARKAFHSIGTCSFDEPREELVELNLHQWNAAVG